MTRSTENRKENRPLNTEQKQLIRISLEKAIPVADDTAALFYRRLSELDPSLRDMCHFSEREQGRHFIGAINSAISSMDRIEPMTPFIRNLTEPHAEYLVRYEHYATVGSALIWALERSLRNAFTPATKRAWMDLYYLMAATMQEASSGASLFRQRMAEMERRRKYAMLQYG